MSSISTAPVRQPRLGVRMDAADHLRRKPKCPGRPPAVRAWPTAAHVDERSGKSLVAVRMVIAHRFADDFGGLDVLAVRHDAEFMHGEKNGRFEG